MREASNKLSNRRPYKAGHNLADALCEVANILYLLNNRKGFLLGIKARVDEELRKLKEGVSNGTT